jgi:exosortase
LERALFQNVNRIRTAGLSLVCALAVVLWGVYGNTEEVATYGDSALWWWWKATAFGMDHDHGRLIPFVCGYLVWLRRKELATVHAHLDWRGLPLAALAMFVYWLGVQGQQVQVALYALWILVWAVVLGGWGSEVTRVLRFPLTYLLLTFPLGFLYPLTFPLRMVSTGMASGLLNGIGIAVVRNGTALYDPSGAFHLEVADPCSGLRSVFALVAVTAIYAYFALKGHRRWLLVIAAAPLAVCANAVRITAVGIVARLFGQPAATGFYHDFSGYVFFASATLLMLAAAWLLAKLPDRGGKRESPELCPAVPRAGIEVTTDPALAIPGHERLVGAATRTCSREWVFFLGIPAVAAVAAVWVVVRPPLKVSDELPIARHLPVRVGPYTGEENYYCQNENCLRSFPEAVGRATNLCPSCGAEMDVVSLAERRGLPVDTLVAKRKYSEAGGAAFSVNTVIVGEDRRSIHRPERCLTAQGFSVERIRREVLTLADGHALDIAVITARRAGSDAHTGFAYWFAGPDRETASNLERHFWTAHDRLLRNTASRWAYVSVFSPEAYDTPHAMDNLRQFLSLLRPVLQTGSVRTERGRSEPQQSPLGGEGGNATPATGGRHPEARGSH